MSDFGSPVVTAPAPLNPLQTLSQLMGIKQQRQTLETGEATQQSAQAKASMDTQDAAEKQSGVRLLQDPVGNGVIDSSGNPTKDSQRIVMQAMPTTGATHYADIVNAAKTKIEFNRSVNNLSSEERTEVGQVAAGIAADPKASKEDAQAQMNAYVESKRGTSVYDDVRRIADTTMHIGDGAQAEQQKSGLVIPSGQEAWRSAHLGIGRTLLGAAGTVGADGLTSPQAVTNAAGQAQDRNRVTGERTMPQLGAGATNPSSPQVAGASARNIATGNMDVDKSKLVSDKQADAANVVQLTQRADKLKDALDNGDLAAHVSQGVKWLGFSSVNEARAQLKQDLGKMRGLVASQAGSDSRANVMLEGYPNDTTPNNTFHADMDYARGLGRQYLARGKLLSQYQKNDPENLRGFNAADNLLTTNSTPLAHEYMALKPEEKVGFVGRNFKSRQEGKEFLDHINALKAHTNVTSQ